MVTRKWRKANSKDRLRKAQLSFYAEPGDYAALKALSARTGVPQQVYLRRGLEYVLSGALELRSHAAKAQLQHQRLRRQFVTLAEQWLQLQQGGEPNPRKRRLA